MFDILFFAILFEIPGYIFHYLTIRRLFRIKRFWPAHAVLLFISFLIVSMVIFIGDWYNLPLTFFLYLSGIQYACTDSPYKKLSLSLMLSSTVFAWNIFLDSILQLYDSPGEMILLRVLFSVFLYLLIRFMGPDKETELGKSLWRLMSFLTLAPMGIVLSIVLIADEEWTFSLRHLFLYSVLLLLTILSFIGLLLTIAVFSKQKKLEQQSLYAEMNQAYYDAMKRQHFEIRRLKHDLSNHLHTLSLLPAQEKDNYIAHLLESPGFIQRTDYCADMTVNAVLSVKETAMRENNISLTYKLDLPEELPFKKVDICVLFANPLDNAIESCLALPKEKRFIELTARYRKGILALSIKNPTESAPPISKKKDKASKSLPSTTKSDKKYHGYGLRSMDTIVTHYKGSMEINADNDIFELFLYLPEP